MKSPLRVSAVIPTWNEAAHIVLCTERLRAAGVAEVIVVDGGSSDATKERALPRADTYLESAGGLFAQLNRGSREAVGDVLLFQYADGLFPQQGVRAVEEVLDDPRIVGGAFRLAFDSTHPAYPAIAFGANVRNRLGFGPFGDQSIFVRTQTFRELGGFDPAAPLAEYELVKKLKQRGKFRLLAHKVRSSVRRWERRGVLRTLLSHWRLSVAYFVRSGHATRAQRGELEHLRRVR